MNYFAHGRHFVDDAYFLAGTALPDWLGVVDRRIRLRSRDVAPFVESSDSRLAAIARGVTRHHEDDAWFHATAAFTEVSWDLTDRAQSVLPDDEGFRPSFLGHILVEILLDSVLIEEDPSQLEAYCAALDSLDAEVVERLVGQMAAREVRRLAQMLPRFSQERFLSDYRDDAKLWFRLNQVMCRVGLPALPSRFQTIFPAARKLVGRFRDDLLRRPQPLPGTTTLSTREESP